MSSRTGVARDALRTQLWPVPVIGVLVAAIAGVGMPRLDARVDDELPAWLTDYLFDGGSDAARGVLQSIAASLITVTSLTFSLTVITLQLASSQYSPRLLRTFSRDGFVHMTLALFLCTFTFALVVLRTVRTGDDARDPFVPQLSVVLALLLALSSVVALVLFLAHLARQIRVETMLRDVNVEAGATLRRVLPERGDTAPVVEPPSGSGTCALLAVSSGFLVGIDEGALCAAAVEARAVVVVQCLPGASLIAGTPIGRAWPREGGEFTAETRDRLLARAGKAVVTGFERTAAQDVGFGLRQLTDVAVKALSPGVNDPTTAVHALGHASALLCQLAGRDLGAHLLHDRDGTMVGVLRRPELHDLVDLVVSGPRRYGAGDPEVLGRLLDLLAELAWHVDIDDQFVVTGQLDRLRATIDEQRFDRIERTDLAERADRVERALAGRNLA